MYWLPQLLAGGIDDFVTIRARTDLHCFCIASSSHCAFCLPAGHVFQSKLQPCALLLHLWLIATEQRIKQVSNCLLLTTLFMTCSPLRETAHELLSGFHSAYSAGF
jgi:hypothetical protein